MRQKLVSFFTFWIFTFQWGAAPLLAIDANSKVKDFRATNQKVALLGVNSEFVDEQAEGRIVEQIRKSINRYTRSYGTASISSFNLPPNTGKKFFATVPADTPMGEAQKKFLQTAGKDNSFEVVALGTLRMEGDDISSDLQLYDLRTDTLSQPINAKLSAKGEAAAIEKQVYTVMNFLDREGFVGATAQDFLLLPPSLQNEQQSKAANLAAAGGEMDSQAVNPNDLGGGFLAGADTVGGEKTPFWETWWFWTIIGGSLLTAGGLTYYFVVVDKPKESASVGFGP